jgi:trehalose-phosphatase
MYKSIKTVFDKDGNISGSLLSFLESQPGIILFLDYDGTLVPIKQSPALAVLSPEKKDLLKLLVKKKKIKVALVSGRSHQDLKSLIKIPGITLVSNHGFRISTGNLNWVHPELKAFLPSLRKISRLLKEELNLFTGTIVEDKTYTSTVHFRNVEKQFIPALKKVIRESVKKYPVKFSLTKGKKIIEVRPAIEWNKGKAVLKLLSIFRNQSKKYGIIYIGDDKTDEDAFGILNDKAITIRVGRSNNSLAKYFLRNSKEVQLFLNKIESLNSIRS